MEIISVDVGLTGAICYFDGKNIKLTRMPTIEVEDSAYKHWYNKNEIINICNKYDPKNTSVFIEYQRPMDKQSAVSVFRLGRGFGLLEGIFSSRFDKLEIVDPKRWHNYLSKKFLTKDEERISKKKESFPELYDSISEEYLEDFEKRVNTKSLKDTKVKSLYILYKSGYIKNFTRKEYMCHDLVDCFLISLYGYLISN